MARMRALPVFAATLVQGATASGAEAISYTYDARMCLRVSRSDIVSNGANTICAEKVASYADNAAAGALFDTV